LPSSDSTAVFMRGSRRAEPSRFSTSCRSFFSALDGVGDVADAFEAAGDGFFQCSRRLRRRVAAAGEMAVDAAFWRPVARIKSERKCLVALAIEERAACGRFAAG